jgi:hypothetical protein
VAPKELAMPAEYKIYCKEHGIKLIEIPYWDYDNIETILKKELKIK